MNAPATALEQSFVDVCERHGLTALSLNYSTSMQSGNFFTAFAHRDGACAGEHGASIAEAIGKALAALNAKAVALADEALPELAA